MKNPAPQPSLATERLLLRPLRQRGRKWDVFEDLAVYGILAAEWRASVRAKEQT